MLHRLHAPPSSSTSSFTLDSLQLSETHQRPAARGVEEIVLYDYAARRRCAEMPAFVQAGFEAVWKEQEDARQTWAGRVKEIERRVEGLEEGSWRREGAVEM